MHPTKSAMMRPAISIANKAPQESMVTSGVPGYEEFVC
jgi:hypothetical protein